MTSPAPDESAGGGGRSEAPASGVVPAAPAPDWPSAGPSPTCCSSCLRANAACASTTQALCIAEDWMRLGRCQRVLVVAADEGFEAGAQ